MPGLNVRGLAGFFPLFLSLLYFWIDPLRGTMYS